MAQLTPYLWVAVLGGIFGFFYGFLIGANDVANSFASSVAAKSLTLKQTIVVAGICEFCGAFFLGASVTSTVRSKVFDVELYADEPALLMFGMFTSLFSAVLMLFIATHLGLPVSTTHDIVGCIMGFTISAKGFSSVDWGVVEKIIISWVASPLIAGLVAAVIFGFVKYFVMKTPDPFTRAYYTFPLVLFVGIGIDLFFILYKASANFKNFQDKNTTYWVVPTAFGASAICGLLWIYPFGPIVRKRIEFYMMERQEAEAKEEADKADQEANSTENNETSDDAGKHEDNLDADDEDGAVGGEDPPLPEQAKNRKWFNKENLPWEQDLHAQSMHESKRAKEIWDEQEKFDEHAECLFNYIQVFTACLNSFAHGANDISNTLAPTSAIIQLYQTGVVDKDAKVPKWILAYAGIALVVGLALYGYRVMKSIGYKLTMLSPSRGAAAELGSSLTVVTASFLSIPVSTTQCIVGGVTAVGLLGGTTGVQWLFLLRVCFGWAVLFVVSVLVSAGVFSFAAYSPDLDPLPGCSGNATFCY